jgi:outer membrane protein OmpA-like peptidoglycan-associated protein
MRNSRQWKLLWGFILAQSLTGETLAAIQLQFRYMDGDSFASKGESSQVVSLNGRQLQSNADTFHSVFQVSVPDGEDARIKVETSFDSESQNRHSSRQETEIRHSEYSVSPNGAYSVEPNTTVPVERSIPTFPSYELTEGQTWTAPGTEIEDLSGIGLFAENKQPIPPLVLSFPVSYCYRGQTNRDGKSVDVVDLEYSIAYRPDLDKSAYRISPVLISGSTRQTIYFDRDLGLLNSYTEQYTVDLVLSNGELYEFSGKSTASFEPIALQSRTPIIANAKTDLPLATAGGDSQIAAAAPNETTSKPDLRPLPPTAEPLSIDAIVGLPTLLPDQDLLVPLVKEVSDEKVPVVASPKSPPPTALPSPSKAESRESIVHLATVSFAANSASLSPTEKEKLSAAIELLRTHPNDDVLIEGFAALVGMTTAQKKLSESRAAAVEQYLIEMGARTLDTIITSGLGSRRPVAPNDTVEGRSLNRRVEIILLGSHDISQQESQG